MRWFIVFLVVANVILFFWVQQESRPLPADVRLPPPDVGRLRLLTEMRPSPSGGEVESADPAAGESPDSNQASEAMVSVDVAPEPSAVQTDTEAVMASDAVHSSQITDDIDMVVADSVVPAGADRRAAVAAETAATTVDAADIEHRVGAPDTPAVVREEQAAATEQAGPACARVGPFAPGDADELISGLPPNITLLSDVAEEYTRVKRYYVIIPPLPSHAEGQKKMKELADAGVTDTWLFRTGEYRNGISLGFFSRKGGAQKRAANVAKKGFNTEIKKQTSVSERRWLVLKNRDGDDLGQSLPLPAGIRAENQSCP